MSALSPELIGHAVSYVAFFRLLLGPQLMYWHRGTRGSVGNNDSASESSPSSAHDHRRRRRRSRQSHHRGTCVSESGGSGSSTSRAQPPPAPSGIASTATPEPAGRADECADGQPRHFAIVALPCPALLSIIPVGLSGAMCACVERLL